MTSEQNLMQMVAEEMASGRLVLPTLPEVALSIGDMIRRDDVDVDRIAREISKDPAIAARLLSAANHVGVRGAGKAADNLKMAITRLGFNLTRALVSRISMEQMFCAKSARLNQIMKRTWTRSLEVAALSRVLATHCTRLSSETAMLAGLIHQVGVLPIIRLFDGLQKNEDSDAQIELSIQQLQAQVGTLVLQKWGFPPELVAIPAAACDFLRNHEGVADYGDVICVAIMQLNMGGTEVRREQVPAFAKLGIGHEVEILEMPNVHEAYEKSIEMLTA